MKKRGIYSFLAAAAGLLLIFGFSSCTRDATQQGEVCFTIPQEVFQQIAARAVTDDKEIDKTSEAEILTVPDDNNLTFEISLWEKSGKIIDSQSASKTFKKWLEASANNDIKFSFQNITVGKTIYATASATAVINGETREICSSVSDPALITQGTNYIPLELTFTVVDNKDDNKDDDDDDDKIKFDITISTDADLTDQKIGAVSLFCVDAEYADEKKFFTKKSGSDTLEISNENIIKLIDNAGDLIETTSGKMVSNLPNTTTIFCSPIATLYSARDEGIIDNGNGKISVNYSTSSYGTIVSDKPVYIIALVTYSEADKTVLPEENHNYVKTQLSSYWRGITKLENISQTELNKVELSINQTGIPCRILIMYGPWDEDLQMTAYTSVSVEGANKMVTDNYKTIGEADLKAIFPDFDFSTYVYNGLSATPESADGINFGACGYINAQGRLEGMSFDAGGGIGTIEPVTDILNITTTPSEKFYLNTGSIPLKAVEASTNTDITNSSDVIWNAKLLYGGVDINGYGIEYYKLFKDGNNKWSVQLANKLATAGTYQLYVTATYNGVTSSQITNVDVMDGEYYEYDVTADNFEQHFGSYNSDNGTVVLGSDLKNLSTKTKIVLSGTVTSEPMVKMAGIVNVIHEITQELELDMSGIKGVTELYDGDTFYAQNLTSIILPQDFTRISVDCFSSGYACTNLKSITMPSSITTIQDGAFEHCLSLEQIIIQGENSKYSVDSNSCLFETDGTNKTLLFVTPAYKANITSINFATDFPGVTALGASIFKDTTLSGELDLTGINSIGASAFEGTGITSIKSFGNITEIPAYAFNDSEITGTIDLTGITSIGDYAFRDCSNLEGIRNYGSLTHIGTYAFSNVKTGKLDELTFSSPNIEIEAWGISVTTLNIGFDITSENYETIRDNFFSGFGVVTNIVLNGQTVLPDLLESDLINGSAISSNSNPHPKALLQEINSYLETITFNNTNNFKIGDYQFAKFSKLKTVTTNGGKINEVGNYAFYSQSTGYSANKISNIDLSVCTKIGDFAFYDCPYFTDATLDLSNVQIIGNQAFKNSSSTTNTSSTTYHSKVTTINLSSATAIGDEAFYGWTSLTTITQLGSSAGCTIGSKAFNTNVTAGISLATVGSTANVVDLTNVKSLGIGAFQNCRQIKKIDFSNNTQLTEITKDAFGENYGLTEIVFSSSIIIIGNAAFSNCSALTALDLSSTNVKIIRENAFYNCFKNSAPTTFKLGNVTQIGHFAFQNSSKLTNVTIPNTVIALGYKAFTGVTSLTIASDPEGKTSSWYAFNYTSGVNQIRNELWDAIFSSPRDNFTDNEIESYENDMIYQGTTYFVPFTVPEGSSIQAEIKNAMTGSGDAATTQPRLIRQYKDNN